MKWLYQPKKETLSAADICQSMRGNRYGAAICAVLLIVGLGVWGTYVLPTILGGAVCMWVYLAGNHWTNGPRAGVAAIAQIAAILGLIASYAVFSPGHERVAFYLNILTAMSLGMAVYGFTNPMLPTPNPETRLP